MFIDLHSVVISDAEYKSNPNTIYRSFGDRRLNQRTAGTGLSCRMYNYSFKTTRGFLESWSHGTLIKGLLDNE